MTEPVVTPAEAETEDAALTSIWERMHAEAATPEGTPADPTSATPAQPGAEEPTAPREDGRDEKGRFAPKTLPAEDKPAAPTDVPANGAAAGQEPTNGDADANVAAPKEVPLAIAQHWKAIPEAARAAILADRQSLTHRLAHEGRAGAEFRGVHERMAQAFPETQQWSPQQREQALMRIANYEQALARDPAGALLATARDMGVLPILRQALGGAGASEAEKVLPTLVAEIKSLREQVAGMPAQHERQREEAHALGETQATIANFRASCGDEWDVLEDSMPAFIAAVRKSHPDASAADVLKEAYEQAAWAHPTTRATRIAAAQPQVPQAQSAPVRQAASERALAASISGRGAAGADQPVSLDAALRRTYERVTAK